MRSFHTVPKSNFRNFIFSKSIWRNSIFFNSIIQHKCKILQMAACPKNFHFQLFCVVFATDTRRTTRQIWNRNQALAACEIFAYCLGCQFPAAHSPIAPTHSPHKILPKPKPSPSHPAKHQTTQFIHAPPQATTRKPTMTHTFPPARFQGYVLSAEMHSRTVFDWKIIGVIIWYVSFWNWNYDIFSMIFC